MIEFIEIIKRVNQALDKLYLEQQELFDNDVNEVTINRYLADFLKKHFQDYDVDTEYNREHIPLLKVIGTKRTITPSGKEEQIKPDIIVHGRNIKISNLLTIECKKQWNKDKKEREKDKQVLGGMTMTSKQAKKLGYDDLVFAYTFGLFIDYGKTRQETIIKKIVNGTTKLQKIEVAEKNNET